jgi:hypothetical protein
MSSTTCSNQGVRDFPIQRTAQLSSSIIDSVKESFLIDIQWATKSSAPEFVIDSNDKGFLREGTLSTQASTTTLRFQGNSYTLKTMQLTKSLHGSFFTEELKRQIPAELVLVFSTTSPIAEKYVLFCIPIFAGPSTQQNSYLNTLNQGRLLGNPISLGTVLPQDSRFIAYSTCLSQLQNNQSASVQARVLMFYSTISFSQVNELKKKLYRYRNANNVLVDGSTTESFPDVRLPDLVSAKTMPVPFTIDNETTFTRFIRSGSLQDSKGQGGVYTREDTTASYKCVPLNPDLHVNKDKKIVIDTRKGELLSDVLNKRQTDLDGDLGRKGLDAEQIETILAVAFGIAIGLLILSILAYFISRVTASEGSFAKGPIVVLPSWITKGAPILVVSLVVGLIGFGTGAAVVAYTR